jgi:hypothetical protein
MQKSKVKALSDYIFAALLYLLINFGVFHSGLYRYLCKPESYAGNVYGRLHILNEIERKNDRKVVALVGDSITEEGIDPARFSADIGKPVANLALPGASPLDWFFFLRAVDPEENRFDSILMTVIPQKVRVQAHDDGIQTLLPVASIPLMLEYLSSRGQAWRYREDYYATFDRIFGFRRDLRELILDPDRHQNVIGARKEQLERIRTYSGQPFDVCEVAIHPLNGRITSWGKIQDPEVRRLTRHNINRISKLNRNPEASGITGPFRRIAESYRNDETEIIIVTVPFGPGNRIRSDSPPIKKYLEELKQLENDFGTQHWIAFEENFLHDCSNFFDYRHLNHKGRLLFSSWLSQRWNIRNTP